AGAMWWSSRGVASRSSAAPNRLRVVASSRIDAEKSRTSTTSDLSGPCADARGTRPPPTSTSPATIAAIACARWRAPRITTPCPVPRAPEGTYLKSRGRRRRRECCRRPVARVEEQERHDEHEEDVRHQHPQTDVARRRPQPRPPRRP